jgi:6-phosphogluconolactonase
LRIIFLFIIFIFVGPSLVATQFLYVSVAGDNAIEVYKIGEDGILDIVQKLDLGNSPGNSVLSPDCKKLFVAVGNKEKTGILTLGIDEKGVLSIIAFGSTPIRLTYLTIDKKGLYLFACHYGEGKISSYKLEDGVYKGKVLEVLATDKNAHCAQIDSNDEYVYFPHTGPNSIYQFQFKDEKLIALNPIKVGGPDKGNNYHEPRHIVFHSKHKILYSSNEFGGGLSRWSIEKNGVLSLKETLKTVSKEITWKNASSDITITPNDKLIFVANRDITNVNEATGNDSVSVFTLDEAGNISKQTGIYPLGRHPRCLHVEIKGKFIFGTAVDSSEISVYEIDYANGTLKLISKIQTGKKPMWMVSVTKN